MDALILVANDDLFFGGRILSVLEKSGFRTATAATGDEVVRKTLELQPTIVLVNLNSKRLGGIDLLRRLKAADSGARILAFLSHMQIPAAKEDILAAGADKLVANSAVSMRLPSIVAELLSGASFTAVDDDED